MQVRIRYYLHFREILGKKEETLTVPEGIKVGELIKTVLSDHRSELEKLGRYQVFKGARTVDGDEDLHDGDVISLTTPLSGG